MLCGSYMQKNGKNIGHIMKYKLCYTALLFCVYMVGKLLPLYGVDRTSYVNASIDAQKLLLQTIGGDIQRISLFALGLSPYMIVMLVVQIINALRKTNTKSKISLKRSNRMTMIFTVILATIQAAINVQNLVFAEGLSSIYLAKCIAILEMVTGTLLIVWMADRNGRYGIGGQTAFICINVLEGILRMLSGSGQKDILLLFVLSFASVFVIILLENAEMHIPMQRISIYNIYADKNYLAFKLNPIGVMPVMFSTAFFMLPQLFLGIFSWVFPDCVQILQWKEKMTLSEPLGIVVYILILYTLTIGFSIIFISPEDLTEQFLKSGDSIVNIHAGTKTKRYLMLRIMGISIFSATIMGSCVGLPLFFSIKGLINPEMAMLPASLMMFTGICCNLFREMKTIHIHDSYKVFL